MVMNQIEESLVYCYIHMIGTCVLILTECLHLGVFVNKICITKSKRKVNCFFYLEEGLNVDTTIIYVCLNVDTKIIYVCW